jgi:hypothetical protein
MPEAVDLIRNGKLFHLPDILWPCAVVLGVEYGWRPAAAGSPDVGDPRFRAIGSLERVPKHEATGLADALERAMPFLPDADCTRVPGDDHRTRVVVANDGIERFTTRGAAGTVQGESLAREAARSWSGPRKELLRHLITWCRMGGFTIHERSQPTRELAS